jgi:caffeoyl-CoA O-methyltransferase
MNIINDMAEVYAKKHTTLLDDVLQQVEDFTFKNHPLAHMISGHVQGKFLQMISWMAKPQYVLEVGTFTGFSAICLAKGLQANGELHTIELREDDAATAKNYFIKVNLSTQIKLHIGNALQIIPTLNYAWDIVFLDADKVNYINYYELILPQLKPGGFILADNVLFHGQVLEETITGKNAIAINEFNKHVSDDKRVEQVLLTVRDGLMMIKKL